MPAPLSWDDAPFTPVEPIGGPDEQTFRARFRRAFATSLGMAAGMLMIGIVFLLLIIGLFWFVIGPSVALPHPAPAFIPRQMATPPPPTVPKQPEKPIQERPMP